MCASFLLDNVGYTGYGCGKIVPDNNDFSLGIYVNLFSFIPNTKTTSDSKHKRAIVFL